MAAPLSELPNEILSQIWGYMSTPEEIENFGAVCNIIRSNGEKILAQHTLRKSAYATLTIDSNESQSRVAIYLKEVLKCPELALYVRNANILGLRTSWWDPSNPDPALPLNRQLRYAQKDMDLFKQAILDSAIILADKEAVCSHWLRHGDEETVFKLLLEKSSDIKYMSFKIKGAEEARHLPRIFESRGDLLPQLAKVHLDANDGPEDLTREWIHILALHPSLRSLLITGYQSGEPLNTTDYLGNYGQSSVTELSMENCSVSELGTLLELFAGLQSFSYTHLHYKEAQFQLFSIKNALLAYTKHSLRSLTLLYPSFDPHDVGTCIRSLRGFRCLETLVCEELFLCCDVSCVVDPDLLLPASIKTLQLFDRDCARKDPIEWAHHTTKEIIEARSGRLEKLETFKIHHANDGSSKSSLELLEASLTGLCWDAGISFEMLKCACTDEDHDCWRKKI